MNNVGNLILTGAALAPVLLVYAIVAFIEREFIPGAVFAFVGLLLVCLGLLLLKSVKRHIPRASINITSVEVAERENLGMLTLYLLPLLRTSFSDLDYVVLIPAMAIFLALAFTGYSFHFNPLLRVFGWNFYRVGTPESVAYILITRQTIRSTPRSIEAGVLTSHTIIDLE